MSTLQRAQSSSSLPAPFASGPLRPAVQALEPARAAAADAGALTDIWPMLRRRRLLIVAAAVACGAAAYLVSLAERPQYQAHTSLEIQSLNENFLQIKDIDPATADGYSAEALMETEVKLLQEEALIERVVTKLHLDARPEFAGAGGRSADWAVRLGIRQSPPSPLERAVAAVSNNLKARAAGQTRIIDIFFDAPDPAMASEVANAVSSEFIEQNLEVRWKAAQNTVNWLTPQIKDLKSKLEKSEDQLRMYALGAGLVFTSEKGSVEEEKLRQIQQELSKAQADLAAKQTRYEVAVSGSVDSLPEILDSGPLQNNQARLTELRRQLAELSSSFTPAYYKVKHVEAQIKELNAAMALQRNAILDRIGREYEAARRLETLVAGQYALQANLVAGQSAKAIQYNLLKREVDSNRALYENILQKAKEATVASTMQATNIRAINPAKPPSRPYRPRPLVNGALSLVVGGFLGIVFAFVRESADRSLKGPGESTRYLRLPELGAIPAATVASGSGVYGAWQQLRRADVFRLKGSPIAAADPAADAIEMESWRRESSPLAESFRTTLTSILLAGASEQRSRIIAVTSSVAGEGKTTVASNLAIALAGIVAPVLLVDGDLRNPRLQRVFRAPDAKGLADVLREDVPIEDYATSAIARATEVEGLYVMPSGRGGRSITNLLYSDRLAALLQRLRREFNAIVIDTPPALPVADARLLGRLADGVILVVRAGHTSRDAVLAAAERLRDDGTPVLGTILNGWNPRDAAYGYGQYPYESVQPAAANQ
jgi:polysaccharide biosynthesis transport protein